MSKLSEYPKLPCCKAEKDRLQYNPFTGDLNCLGCGRVYEIITKHDIRVFEELRNLVWEKDITSPTTPEYREHHEDIQAILKFINTKILREEE